MDTEHTYDCGTDAVLAALFGGWRGPAIGLMDLDAFFASVEQLDHPEWRGRPVIVGGSARNRGVVSTASYEARAFGVHSAMPSAQAERLCPDAIWTPGRFDRYREVSASVMRILEDETPYVDRVSIDEAFFDISPGRFSTEDPITIARRISSRVAALGVTCSIGLGCNKTVAKIASERDKPRGLTIVVPGTEGDFLAPLPVRAMSGIGRRAEAMLAHVGIHTLGDLSRAPIEALIPLFGARAEAVRERAAGRERSRVSPIDEPDEVKSISNERTFSTDLVDRDDIEAAIRILGESVGRRMRARGLAGRTVTLKLKFTYESGRSAQRKLPHPTDDENVFGGVAIDLLDQLWSPGMRVRLIGIGMGGFKEEKGVQTDLFCTLDERGAWTSDRRNLAQALDAVRDRFGTSSVEFGRSARFGRELVDPSKFLSQNKPMDE
ncbi:MAG: DNA polymerase IV [Collinsella sp.]|nr:DNA polymerase IV [Collinsella sp.]